MFDILRIAFYAGAMFAFLFFLGLLRRKEWKKAAWAIVACILLGALGYGSVALNNARISGNRVALGKSSVIQTAMKNTESRRY